MRKKFDTYDFIKQSKILGVAKPIAEFQAQQIELAINTAVIKAKEKLELTELKSESEIKKAHLKLKQAKNQIIIWVACLFLASGLIQHFFK